LSSPGGTPKESILGLSFCPKQGQGCFRPSVAPLNPNMGQVFPPGLLPLHFHTLERNCKQNASLETTRLYRKNPFKLSIFFKVIIKTIIIAFKVSYNYYKLYKNIIYFEVA